MFKKMTGRYQQSRQSKRGETDPEREQNYHETHCAMRIFNDSDFVVSFYTFYLYKKFHKFIFYQAVHYQLFFFNSSVFHIWPNFIGPSNVSRDDFCVIHVYHSQSSRETEKAFMLISFLLLLLHCYFTIHLFPKWKLPMGRSLGNVFD